MMMMKILNRYEKLFGQLINLNKSFLYIHENVLVSTKNRIRKVTGIDIRNFPFIYLSCPIFYGRKKKSHFEEMVKKRRVMA